MSMVKKPDPLRKLDERFKIASMGRTMLAKVFPDHWSFMLGEIALYSFILLVATGIYLTMFFEPSSHLRTYHGSYAPLHDRTVTGAYASTVALSWDIRGGLLMRQAHHWAAHIFIGAIVLHLCRIFFTGMYRKPRELNWMVGLTLLILAILNAFAGYSLPDDLLSGTGLHIFNSIMLSIPVVGAWMTFLVFGGEFPGVYIIERLYPLHILIIPAVIALLIAVHLGSVIRQKHTHFSGPGRRGSNVVGSRMWPTYALRSLGLLAAVTAVVFLAGGFIQINPIWVWGDYEPQTIMSPSVADWYIVWIEGGLRLFPPVEFTVFGYLVANQFWAGVVLPGVTFGLLYIWPFLERRVTGDRAAHHVTGRPRDAPGRVAVGAAALAFYSVLLIAGGEELIVEWTGAPIGTVRATLRVLVLTLPVLAAALSWWLAEALRRSERTGLLGLSRTDLVWWRTRDEDEEDRGEAEEPAETPPDETVPAEKASPEEVHESSGKVPEQ